MGEAMPELSAEELEIRQRLKDDLTHYSPRCLKIRTKAGGVQSLFLNRPQQYLHAKLERQLAEKGMVRALILKGRQMGISTYIQARFYHRVSHRRGVRAFILTHQQNATENIFGITDRFHENCPSQVRPHTGHSNAKELKFDLLDSGYAVGTAGTVAIGRSDTIQFFHGSEIAFWPNAESHIEGIGEAIADVPGTEDIRESTANGVGNVFHSMWRAAERGESDYEAIFLPWYWHDEYSETPPDGWGIPEKFAEYGETYGLTKPQLYWAWKKNRDLAITLNQGSDEFCWKFKQEYPADPNEAFQMSGADSYIATEKVAAARTRRIDPYGPIILGVDPARGGKDGTGFVDRQLRRLGMNVCERFDSDDLMVVTGEVVKWIRKLTPLGLKKVVIDVGGLGAGVYDRLVELEYGDMVEAVNFGATAKDKDRMANRRVEIWTELMEYFGLTPPVQIADSDEFHADICAPAWGKGATRYRSNGQLVLEEKDHIRERLKFSPDLGDAAALTFALDMNEVMGASDEADQYGQHHMPQGQGGWLGA